MSDKRYIAAEARITNSDIDDNITVYSGAEIINSKLGKMVSIGNDSIVQECEIKENVQINRRNYLYRSSVGNYSYTGIGTMIRSAEIGKFCSISWNVSIGGGDHDYTNVTTSSPSRFFMMDTGITDHIQNIALQRTLDNLEPCIIGNDVWIATNVVILRGIEVGNGAVIGAGAVVTRDVEPYSVIVGVPSKPIKKRFDNQAIERLEKIKWWDWPNDVLRENANIIYSKNVTDEVLSKLEKISAKLNS